MAKFQMYGRIIQLLRWKVDYTENVRQHNDDGEVTETEQARTEYFASEAEADACAERTGGTKSAVAVAQSDEWLDGLEVEDVPDTYSRAVEIAAMGQAAYEEVVNAPTQEQFNAMVLLQLAQLKAGEQSE